MVSAVGQFESKLTTTIVSRSLTTRISMFRQELAVMIEVWMDEVEDGFLDRLQEHFTFCIA